MTSAVPYWRLSSFYFSYFSLLGATAPFLALYFHHLGTHQLHSTMPSMIPSSVAG